MPAVFFTFRDSLERRRALEASPGSAERYVLFGLDQLAVRGFSIHHNLERRGAPPRWAALVGSALKRGLERAGGYGGDFARVLASLRRANRADVVFSTVDTVGIPLMLLARAGRLRPPLVYVAIGLPERLAQLRSERMRRLYASALGGCASVIAYSEHEADELRSWLERYGFGPRVEFVPFGVDTEWFGPTREAPKVDVVSVGADPHRDFALLGRVAERLPEVSFRIVTSVEHARSLPTLPGNVVLETEIPFQAMRQRLAEARVVALPVRENSYSGATTVLLQAMALGKPVVVTRTQAIATGYGLVDGENCRLVAPGDEEGFERALTGVLGGDFHARALGSSARTTVERELTWERYVDRIEERLRDAASTPRPSSPGAA
ncbi:MAG: glycosyltransferase family 4 protein [Actinomycetota bacterium]|nr:glycosyltransferase family 4 protein [Actinomycetota bacterium]